MIAHTQSDNFCVIANRNSVDSVVRTDTENKKKEQKRRIIYDKQKQFKNSTELTHRRFREKKK